MSSARQRLAIERVTACSLRLDLLAEHVTWRRLDAGLTQRDVAHELGLSASTLCRIEAGFAADLETFAKVCAWLGNSPAVYLGLSSALPLPRGRCGKCERVRKLLEEP
jgi:transcriptional regulator with XRE-family HTH domain